MTTSRGRSVGRRLFERVAARLRAEPTRTIAIAALVATSYYAGSRIGFLLKFPPLTPSVLWPPNAILTATLLLTPPARWPIYLLAALPAHLAVQLGQALQVPLMLILFLTNCSEALIAAVLVRRFSPGVHATFDSLRSAAVFIVCAGLTAPFLSSFLDAGAVWLLRGEDYWLVWRTRFFANALTELTLVPSVLMAIAGGAASTRRNLRRRRVEAVVIWLGIIAVSAGLVAGPAIVPTLEMVFRVPLVLVLPLLLWVAIRFGPAGTSAAILTVAVIAIVAGIRANAQNPLAALSPVDHVLSLQITLISLAIPLMCLAAVIDEHERTQRTLERRLEFEEVLSRLSRDFVSLPSHDIDAAIGNRLRKLSDYLGADHITIFQFSPTDRLFVPTHSSASENSSVLSGASPTASWEELSDLPLLVTDVCILSFGPLASGQSWPRGMMPQLRLVAEVFANAIARKKVEDALRASENMSTAILGSLSSSVAVLARDGRVVAMNDAWYRFGPGCQDGAPMAVSVGLTSESLCRDALGASPLLPAALAGIHAVIDGKEPEFLLEYPRPSTSGEQWFSMSVQPLKRAEGGAVVAFTDVTERQQMALDAEKLRQELAHFTRVSTMGELTASLAHELNQPLTGILANAQAAQRFLAGRPPNLAEVRECLSDIVADDRRAGEVIRRVRELLRKSSVRRGLLDVNNLILDVARLLRSDALIRDISLSLDLDRDLLVVNADRVQLQQVVLNVLVNAMEAVTARPGPMRMVTIRTTRNEREQAHVAVEDTGGGLTPEAAASMFEPFYSTKTDGMGMGLCIARSIVLANGGNIWATNNSDGGATFHFTVPLASTS